MEKEIKKKSSGRPSVMESESLTEKYINIWCAHFFKKLPIWDLMKEYNCSKNTIKKAITFVNKFFAKIPNKELLRGSIFAIEERIKKLTAQLEIEYKRKEPSVRNIKELNSEIRSDQIELDKLQNIYSERYSVEVEAGSSIKDILREITKEKK